MTGRKQILELAAARPVELLLLTDSAPAREVSLVLKYARKQVILPERLMEKIVPVENHQSMLAFFAKPGWEWNDLTPYLLVLDRIQDPGNLGTLLRSAAATGIFSIATTPGTVSVFNSKALRASTGLLFRVPFQVRVPREEIARRGYRIYAADAAAADSAFEADFQPPLALVLGSEGQGFKLESDWPTAELVRIPMSDETDSLNAGVAGSILMYEIYRRFGHAR